MASECSSIRVVKVGEFQLKAEELLGYKNTRNDEILDDFYRRVGKLGYQIKRQNDTRVVKHLRMLSARMHLKIRIRDLLTEKKRKTCIGSVFRLAKKIF